jgi:hypothetical protein
MRERDIGDVCEELVWFWIFENCPREICEEPD